ncbi:MAG: ketoacyl-ACP synthase III [Myxococcota bacterium]
MTLHLLGMGHFHPPNVLDNAFFASLDIGTDEAWILSRVGIVERRTVLPLDYLRATKNADPRAAEDAATLTNAATGARAAEMAIERAGLRPEDIGMVICGGCSPQWVAPAEAAVVARELGLDGCPCLDLHAACSTFGTQVHVAASMGEALPDYVLLLQVENNTRCVDYRDRSGCVLWGDGSAAAVVSPRVKGRARIVHTSVGGSPSGAMDVVIPRTGFFAQDGKRVHKFAIKRMAELFRATRARSPRPEEVVFVGHQANLSMLENVARRTAPAGHWFNIDRFGNQGGAGSPCVISQHWEDISPGTPVASVVVGAGLSWAGVLIEF